MVWIPSKEIIKIGDRVRLTRDVSSLAGTLKAGTIVTITGDNGYRGFDYEDDEGHRVTEAGVDCEKL